MSCGNLTAAQCCADLQNQTPALINQCLSHETRWAATKRIADKLIDLACQDPLVISDCAAYVGTVSSGFYAVWLANNVGGYTTRPTCSECHELVIYNTQNSGTATFRNCVDDGNGGYTLSNLNPATDANWVRTGVTGNRLWDGQLWGWEASYVRAGQTTEAYTRSTVNAMRFDNPVIRDAGLTGLFTYDGTNGSIVLPVGSYQLRSDISGYVTMSSPPTQGTVGGNMYATAWHDFYTSTSIYIRQGSGTTPTAYAIGRHQTLFYYTTGVVEFVVTGTPMTIYPRIYFITLADFDNSTAGLGGTLNISLRHGHSSIQINKVG